MTEIEQLRSDIKLLQEGEFIHVELHKKQEKRIENLESVVQSLVLWHTPEGFLVEGLIERG